MNDDFDVYGDGREKDSLISLRQRKIYNKLYEKRFKKSKSKW